MRYIDVGRAACRMLFAVVAFALLAGVNAPAQSPSPAPTPCANDSSREFDFWVGAWTVTVTGKPDRLVATSLIEKLYGGCAIRENWMPLRGAGTGGSLSTYDRGDARWHQTWIDSAASRVEFVGGWNDRAMVLTGLWPSPGHERQLTRMTYTREANAAVRQRGETSDDAGATWQPSFDFTYAPASKP